MTQTISTQNCSLALYEFLYEIEAGQVKLSVSLCDGLLELTHLQLESSETCMNDLIN